MHSFKNSEKNIKLPLSAIWLMNSISEYKGKQELYTKQSPQILKALVEMALIESAESSNRIEGVTIERKRLKPLLIGHSKPRDRSEEEVSGYRKALSLIHKKHTSLDISPKTIQELHRLCRAEVGDAGKWKQKDNEIIKKYKDGSIEIIFKPTSAKATPKAIEQLCLAYKHSIDQLKYPPLYSIACLIFDFLCIHPFRDGNGRVSRLLTLLALYQQGYDVGKYISLERIIEQSKESYYEVLNKSSDGWHTGKHSILPWALYFLGTMLSAYKEFEQRAGNVKSTRGTKTEVVIQAIMNQLGEFTISEIERACPGVSRDMIRVVFRKLQKEKKIKCLGKGKTAQWKKAK
ncbi:MAG: Fic family protein [Candidatus Omnitrophica bacterium]|nr:Fic family protein [Candidatus Omnitrophota bacterium]